MENTLLIHPVADETTLKSSKRNIIFGSTYPSIDFTELDLTSQEFTSNVRENICLFTNTILNIITSTCRSKKKKKKVQSQISISIKYKSNCEKQLFPTLNLLVFGYIIIETEAPIMDWILYNSDLSFYIIW